MVCAVALPLSISICVFVYGNEIPRCRNGYILSRHCGRNSLIPTLESITCLGRSIWSSYGCSVVLCDRFYRTTAIGVKSDGIRLCFPNRFNSRICGNSDFISNRFFNLVYAPALELISRRCSKSASRKLVCAILNNGNRSHFACTTVFIERNVINHSRLFNDGNSCPSFYATISFFGVCNNSDLTTCFIFSNRKGYGFAWSRSVHT